VHGYPLIFQNSGSRIGLPLLPELAPFAYALVVEVSQGRSLHLSG